MIRKQLFFVSMLTLLIFACSSCGKSNKTRMDLNEYAFPSGKNKILFTEGKLDEYKGFKRRHLIYKNAAYTATAYLLKPINSTAERAFIVHGGHGQSALENWDVVRLILDEGHAVYAIGMPCSEAIPCLGSPHWRHEILYGFSELESPLGALLAQTMAALNHSKSNDVTMTGISGGGWTTVVAAALDERITRSIPVAGSLPLDQYEPGKPLGDAEQVDQRMLSICDYRCLYALGASNGIQIQINNSHDPCCFAGNAPLLYESDVQKHVTSNGIFKTVIDDNDEHSYGEKALKYVQGRL